MRRRSPLILVDLDVSIVGLDARLVESQPLGERYRANGEQRVRAVDRPTVVTVDRDSPVADIDGLGTGSDDQPHPPLDEVLLQHGGHLGVPVGKDLLSGDHQAHRGSHTLEDVGELDTGDTGADDHDVLRDRLEVVAVAGGQHPVPHRRCPGGDPGRRAGRDHRLVEVNDSLTSLSRHHGLIRPREAALSQNHVDILRVQELQPVPVDVRGDLLDADGEIPGIDVAGVVDQTQLDGIAHRRPS